MRQRTAAQKELAIVQEELASLRKVSAAAEFFMEEVTEDCPTLNKVAWTTLDKALAAHDSKFGGK